MIKKLLAGISFLLIIVMLSGCQLAREDASGNGMDRLMGVYITYEHVDLFDLEGYINDNYNFSGGEINSSYETKKYEGRIYATRKDELKTASGGEKHTNTNFVFEELQGISMFAANIVDPLQKYNSYTSTINDGLEDAKFNLKNGDNEDLLELSGTVYIASGDESVPIYINPVYQSEDGKVYMVPGQGFCSIGDSAEGLKYSEKFESTVALNENGKIKTYRSIVNISVANMNPTIKVGVLQIDKDGNLVKKHEYAPKDVPNEIKTEYETEYIILESTKESFSKEIEIERQIFSKNDETFWFFEKNSDKTFGKSYRKIIWK